jgi:hypothetical protein
LFTKILFRAYFHFFFKFGKKLAENLLGSGSGTGFGDCGRFRKSDPDPVKNRPDPQHWSVPGIQVPVIDIEISTRLEL